MQLTAEQLAAIAAQAVQAALASQTDDVVTAKVKANAPKPATQAKPDAPKHANARTRNLTPMLVVPGKAPKDFPHGATLPDGVAFLVTPCDHNGGLLTRGARVACHVDGKRERALHSLIVVEALASGTGETVAHAIDTVSKRALIGEYKPQEVAA
jgi:hypothetical protein